MPLRSALHEYWLSVNKVSIVLSLRITVNMKLSLKLLIISVSLRTVARI
jgi:hypothetical protein